MTREEAGQKAKIMQAYADGKDIEFYDVRSNQWAYREEPNFLDRSCYYRVKADPKYRPFNNAKECFEEMKKHEPFGWVRSKESGRYFHPVCYSETEVIMISSWENTYEGMIEDFTFLDGSPFGIKEEES